MIAESGLNKGNLLFEDVLVAMFHIALLNLGVVQFVRRISTMKEQFGFF